MFGNVVARTEEQLCRSSFFWTWGRGGGGGGGGEEETSKKFVDVKHSF